MAGGAYKGLTIRIGADTTKLSSALRGASSAIYKAESDLRKLTKAAQLDPGNRDIATKQIGAIADEAVAAAAKLDTLNKSMKEMSDKKLERRDGTVGDLAEQTKHASLAAEDAKDRYNHLTDSLSGVYKQVKEVSNLDLGDFTRQSADEFEESVKKLRSWGDEVDKTTGKLNSEVFEKQTGKTIEDTVARIRELKEAWNNADADFTDAKMVEALHNAGIEATATEAKLNAVSRAMADIDKPSKLADGLKDQDDKIERIGAAVETASDRFKRLDQAAKLNPGSLGTMIDRAKALSEATEAARAKASALKEKLDVYKSAGVDKQAKEVGNVAMNFEKAKSAVSETTMRLSDFEGKLRNAKNDLQKMRDNGVDRLSKEFTDAQKSVYSYEKEVDKAKAAQTEAFANFDTARACSEYEELETQVREANAEIKNLGKGDGVSVSAAAVQAASAVGDLVRDAGQKVIQSSDDIDKAYRNLRKTFDAEESDYQRLYDAAMEYSQSHVTSADSMLDMEAIAAQLGVGIEGGAEAIQKFADAAANLDVATDIDADTIALQMGQIMNVMSDVSPDNIDKFGDALVRLGNNMPTQESNIMQITQRLSAVGDVAGFTTPELMGWAAAIASTGQKSEAAASGISTTIMNIAKAVSAGGDEVKKFADVAGMSADQFVEEWRSKPSETLKKVVEGLRDSGDELFATLNDMDVSGVRQSQTLASLAQTVDMVDNSITMASDAFNGVGDQWGDSGDAAREAEKKAEGFSGTLAKLQNSTDVLAASFGDALVPWMQTATDWIQKLTNFVNGLGDGFKSGAVGVGLLLAGFATIQPVAAALLGHLKTLAATGLAKLVGSFVAAGTEIKGVIDSIMLFKMGEGASLGAVLAEYGTKTGEFITAMSGVKTAILDFVMAGNLAVGVFGAIAVACGIEYIKYFHEANTETRNFNAAVDGMKGTVEGLSAELWAGRDTVKDYGASYHDAINDVNDFFKAMQEHNRVNEETRETAVTTIGELERYSKIVQEAAGKGSEFAGSELELKTAIDGLNDILGTNYKMADVLSGVYLDESGAAKDLASSIDQLVEAKKREIRLGAMEDIYKEDFKAQAEAQNAYDKAVAAREKYMSEMHDKLIGTTQVDPTTKNTYVVDESNWEDLAKRSDGYRQLSDAVTDVQVALNETNEALDLTEKQWEGYADELAYLETANFGVREGIVMTSSALSDAIMENTNWGKSLQEIQPEVGELSQKLQDAKVGATEFAELAKSSPDVFEDMVKKADGDMDKLVELIGEWNTSQLEEKYGKFDYDEKAFIDAEGNRTEWNGGEWETKRIEVENYTTDVLEKVKYDLGGVLNELDLNLGELSLGLEGAGVSTEQFASLSEEQFRAIASAANGNIEGIVGAIAGLNGIQLDDKTMGFHFDEEGNLVNAENELVTLTETGWDVKVGADTSQADADVSAEQAKVEGSEAEMQVGADTSDAEASVETLKTNTEATTVKVGTETTGLSSDPLAGYESKEIKLTVTVDKSQLEGLDEMLAKDSYNISVTVTTNTDELGSLNEALSSLDAGDKTINVTVTADLANLMVIMTLLALVPSEVKTNIVVTATRITTDTSNIEALNDAVSDMSDKRATYTALGNAATGKTPATNIQAANAAGNAMRSHSVSANVTGNAVSGSAAKEIWATIRAINAMSNKTVTITTVKETKTKQSAAGAYIPYNKIPRHAAGIFTRPTLTNIGWVGEDGAELYSGNSLVPLTNRKYSMPYINDISDAVARKMGKELGGAGDSITITINGVSGPDETAQAIAKQLRLMGIAQGRR